MKDSIARDEVRCLQERVKILEKAEPDFIIRQCPKCKHETVQVKKSNRGDTMTGHSFYIGFTEICLPWSPDYDYTVCTNCGIKVECVTETTCREYRD